MATPPAWRNALPLGARLHEYVLEQVLGAGGFGITYLARDTHLDKPVAIKEYLPAELAMRAPGGGVAAISSTKDSGYRWGLERFLQEARTLAKFNHPAIVRVLRYFEANGTAYMVMEYERGEPLKNVLILSPQPPEAELRRLVAPLLDGLAEVHGAGYLHRDIKPDNVFVRADGRPVLIDFGAARNALGGETRSLTAVLTPGYAPLEQYSGEGRQGPWTDLYAMGGVLYRAVTDRNPPDAVARLRADTVREGLAAVKGRYSESFLAAIEWALAMDEKSRPKSVAEWKAALLADGPPIAAAAKLEQREPAGGTTLVAPARAASAAPAPAAALEAPRKRRRWPYYVAIAFAAIAAVVLLRPKPKPPAAESPTAQAPVRPAEVAAAARPEPPKPKPPAVAKAQPATEAAPAPKKTAVAPPASADPSSAAKPRAAAETPSAAAAASAPEADKAQRFLREVTEQFKAADADRDGYLSRGEAERFPALARRFAMVDQDGDGRISVREFAQARREQLERRLAKKTD